MLVADVKVTEDGINYLDIVASEDDGDDELSKTIKTAASRRKVPIHPSLLNIGFLEYASSLKDKGEKRLFPSINPNKYGNLAVYPLKRFREKFLPEAIELNKRQSFYSFRHSFRDALRSIEAPPDVLKALGAWDQGTVVSDDYGDKFDQLPLLKKYVDQIEYPGLDLSHLYAKEEKA